MKCSSVAILLAFAGQVFTFEPNKGPECKLTCRKRVSLEHCPSFRYVNGFLRFCTLNQYGCLDDEGDHCDQMMHRSPLCVVTGPCHAGPLGCLDDKTGQDDGLPPGEYVGHCPGGGSPEEECEKCRTKCAMRHRPGGDHYQHCMRSKCEMACPAGLLWRIQYNDAKRKCAQKGLEFGDNKFLECVKDSLGNTVMETWRCEHQYSETVEYCRGLNYTQGHPEFHGCIAKSMEGICDESDRCRRQFDDARTYCIDKGHPTGGSDFQKCISDQLVWACPKDFQCEQRHWDARAFCRKAGERSYFFGSPEFQQCVAELLDPSCPKDFNCALRDDDSREYCIDTRHLSPGSDLYWECIKECIGEMCPRPALFNCPVSAQYAVDL